MVDLFPADLRPSIEASLPDFTYVVQSPKSSPRRRSLRIWRTPKMRGGVLKFLCTLTEMRTLRQFSAYHQAVPFDFRYPWPDFYYNMHVGVGDGVATAFDLPVHDSASRTVKVDGTDQVQGVDVSIAVAGGDNGRDRVTFLVSPPSAGALITIDTDGYRQILVELSGEFDPKELGRDAFSVKLEIDEV